MKLEALGTQEKWATDATHVLTLDHADLTEAAAATAQVVQIKDIVPGHIIEVVGGRLVTPFKDASDAAFNSITVTVGDGADPDAFMTAWQVNENGTEEDFAEGTGTRAAYNVADGLDLTVNSMAAKALVNIDTGELRLFVKVIDLSAA